MTQSVTIQSRHISFPVGGINRSEVIQQFADKTVEDLGSVAGAVNENKADILNIGSTVLQEMSHLKNKVKSLEVKQDFRERNAVSLVHTVDLFNKANFSYATSSAPVSRLVQDQRHGQIYLPPSSITPLFFKEEPSTGDIIVNNNIDARVTSIAEGTSGSYQPVITQGELLNAFNGYNTSYWIRKVEYPSEAPVTEVEIEVEIVVPSSSPSEFNVFSLAPHPLGRSDITGVWYKERAESATWTLLEEFPTEYDPTTNTYVPIPISEATNLQWIGQVRPVYAFKIGIKQRDWYIENNKKVFVYGAQEIYASLTRFSNISSIDPFDTANNSHLIYKIVAPEGTNFGALSKIVIAPDPKTEGGNINDNHVLYQLAKVPEPSNSTEIIWTSNTSALPQNASAIDLSSLSYYYLIISMKYVSEVTKDLSVFKSGTTPVVDSVYLVHTLEFLEEGGTEEAGAIDWTGRNSMAHFQNMMMMDSYRGSIEDGGNLFIMWDDFWEDYDWRTSLEGNINGSKINSEYMALTVESDVPGPTGAGSMTYLPLTSAEWGSAMNPRRIRLQSAISNILGSNVSFVINYEINNAPQTALTITHAELVGARGSIPWRDLPGSNPTLPGYIGPVTSLSIKAVLVNGTSSGARPLLYQFALIVKD